MERGQNGKWSKWKVVKMKKYRQVDNMKSAPTEKWSEWKVVQMERSPNGK